MNSSDSSSEDGEVHHADMERAFAILDLPSLLDGTSIDMYVQAVRELTCIFSNDHFWSQASKRLISSVIECALQAINSCDWDSQDCQGTLDSMMKAAGKQKALQKSKKTSLFAYYRTAGIMHSRRRKKKQNGAECDALELPVELLVLIFQCLDPKAIIHCILVCKEWNDIIRCHDDLIWRKHLRMTFGEVKTRLVYKNQCRKAFSEYAAQFPFMLIPYQTKRICVQGCVRKVNPITWKRMMSGENNNEYGIALKAVMYPRVPMFLLPSEVVFWLNRPFASTLESLAQQWISLKEQVCEPREEDSERRSSGRKFWQ